MLVPLPITLSIRFIFKIVKLNNHFSHKTSNKRPKFPFATLQCWHTLSYVSHTPKLFPKNEISFYLKTYVTSNTILFPGTTQNAYILDLEDNFCCPPLAITFEYKWTLWGMLRSLIRYRGNTGLPGLEIINPDLPENI